MAREASLQVDRVPAETAAHHPSAAAWKDTLEMTDGKNPHYNAAADGVT